MTTLSLKDYIDDKRCQGRDGKVLLIKEGTGDAQSEKEETAKGGVERGADSKPRGVGPSEIKVFRVSHSDGWKKRRNRSFKIKEIGGGEGDA